MNRALKIVTAGAFVSGILALAEVVPEFQYKHGDIEIGRPSAAEPKRRDLSVSAALAYLDNGALAWSRERKCVSCHTTGTYGLVRPQLSAKAGKPSETLHEFFLAEVKVLESKPRSLMKTGQKAEQVIYLAAALAQWDKGVTGKLSPETDQALRLMFELQLPTGTWGASTCWPPLESSDFQAATIAAQAVASAPGWLAGLNDPAVRAGVERLRKYLIAGEPQNDYDRVSLLWAATLMPELMTTAKQKAMIGRIFELQKADGGWSLRSFSEPEKWGSGIRSERLRAEPDFKNPPSDGHMTGLAVLVLRKAGVSKQDPRIQRGVEWLRTNQRQSGRWWTKALSSDKEQFITYSGTAYPVLALSLCDAL